MENTIKKGKGGDRENEVKRGRIKINNERRCKRCGDT